MLVDYLGADRCVYRAGNSQPLSGEKHGQFTVRQRKIVECACERLAHSPPVFHSSSEGLVHAPAGFLGHAERSVDESAGYVFRRGAEAGDLIVVDRRGAVHREVRYHPAIHQVDEQRRQTGFHDVSAQHHDDRALFPGGGCDRAHDAKKILCHQNVGQRLQEGAEAAVSSRRGREFGGRDFVGAPFDWNGADFGEIGFRDRPGRRAPFLRPRRFVLPRAGTAVTAYGFGDGK
jgi:hypothetical protein